MFRVLVLAVLLGVPALASAQPGSENRIGLGVRVEPTALFGSQSELEFGMSPTFSVPANVNGVFRIEPQFGYASVRSSRDDNDQVVRQTRLGLTVAALVPGTDVVLTPGARIRYVRLSSGSDRQSDDDVDSALSVGPLLGGEYPFSARFSIGGEVGVEYRFYSFERSSSDVSGVGTTAAVAVRFFL